MPCALAIVAATATRPATTSDLSFIAVISCPPDRAESQGRHSMRRPNTYTYGPPTELDFDQANGPITNSQLRNDQLRNNPLTRCFSGDNLL
jgi:hypothetical protein